jgi:glucose-1-phosphate adenylyltransferase
LKKIRVLDNNVISVIMGGGAGSRLFPLTHKRAKPAVPMGGKYRLIDIPISNCLNSGLNRIYILTQFNCTSLHRHIASSYQFDRYGDGFVEILAAQQTPEFDPSRAWYEGNADAVRKNVLRLRESGAREVLILSGDQLYQMDYSEVLQTHRGNEGLGACDVTIAALLVSRERARSLGIMKIDANGRVLAFVEKPGSNDRLFEGLEAPPELLRKFSLPRDEGPYYLANMGIYAFNLSCLEEALTSPLPDFGRDILPGLLGSRLVRAHLFHGYWEDIGTIKSFHQANLGLAREEPPFNFYLEGQPVYTRARHLPASAILGAAIRDSLVSDGCRIRDAAIESSLVGIRSIIGRGCTLRNTYVMGADFYETDEERQRHRAEGDPDLGIGDGSVIENAIIDKNARVGRNVSITNRRSLTTFGDGEDGPVVIRDGIVIVPRGGVVPDGFTI